MTDDFIGEYENVVPQAYCDMMIEYFNKMKDINSYLVQDRQYSPDKLAPTDIEDKTIFLMSPESFLLDKNMDVLNPFVQSFYRVYNEEYMKRYGVLSTAAKHGIYSLRFQKTQPGQGYHAWHFENSAQAVSTRFITFMLYLNDVDEGGETEFLYLHKRVKPKAGKLLIWPGSYTHTHRGNPPLTGDKYAITGWLNFLE
jgi:hypothetical protein